MASYKSPSGRRWLDRRDTREILATRRARAVERKHGLQSHYPETYADEDGKGVWLARSTDYESRGHHRWSNLHKNLARPILRTGRVRVIDPVDSHKGVE